MKAILKIHLVFALISVLSCNDGKETDSVSARPVKDYNTDLVSRVRSDAGSLTYILNGYGKRGEKEYLNVTVSGSNLNSETFILVQNWNKLEDVKRTEGLGYRGAELKGLKLAVIDDALATFAYKDLDKVLD
ncbi:hypothetical protein [Pedobacter heparinus]|uniref:hypothetical protein n=1 Tax=Pedobacter heparinus TaxID=984 RepID=UPI00292DD1B3|nr:hypothetical protein [Pedobacter heparinus]